MNRMRESRIIEDGIEQSISEAQEAELLATDVIFDGGEGCYRLSQGKTWADADAAILRVSQAQAARVQAAKNSF